jgi:hypothetical protein
MKRWRILLIASIIVHCSFQKGNAQGIGPKNEPFYSEFIDSVPELKVPIEFNCGFENLILTFDQREKLRPFTPAGFEIIGKLLINPDFNLIICGELVGEKYIPYLFVTNEEGMENSNQKLFEDTCARDSTSKVKYVLNVISQSAISVSEIKLNATDHQEIKVIFEISKKGVIKRKKE